MAWFTPTHIKDHPCRVPNREQQAGHRIGEMWRCEVCEDLWVLRGGGMAQVDSRRTRWRYHHQGYTVAQEREIGRNG